MSTEIAARREARKRRILENSQQRLSKIISCDKNKVSGNETDLSDKGSSGYNGNATVSHTHERFELPSSPPEPEVDTKTPDVINPTLQKRVNESVHYPMREYATDNYVYKTDSGLSANDSGESAKDSEDPNHQLFWVNCLFIISLSIIVRLMYQFNMSSLFVECLLIPFVTISLAKIAANPRKRLTNPAIYETYITAVLFLCGVPKNWLAAVLYMHMFVDLFNDFALYLFSFIMTHVCLESFVIR